MANDIIVTSGDLKNDYQIIGMISHYFSSIITKKPENSEEIFDFVVEKLKEKAKEIEGYAIIAIRFQREYIGGNYVQGPTLFAYGTVVKFN